MALEADTELLAYRATKPQTAQLAKPKPEEPPIKKHKGKGKGKGKAK